MVANGSLSLGDGVEDTYGVGLVEVTSEFVGCHLAEITYFGVAAKASAALLASENGGGDRMAHVLVDAGELTDLDHKAGLFCDLASEAVADGFVNFRSSRGT